MAAGHDAIVVTHDYLNATSGARSHSDGASQADGSNAVGGSDGERLFQMVRRHPNVFLVLCGNDDGEGYHVNYEMLESRNGLDYFTLKAGNGLVIGASEMYSSKTAARMATCWLSAAPTTARPKGKARVAGGRPPTRATAVCTPICLPTCCCSAHFGGYFVTERMDASHDCLL